MESKIIEPNIKKTNNKIQIQFSKNILFRYDISHISH